MLSLLRRLSRLAGGPAAPPKPAPTSREAPAITMRIPRADGPEEIVQVEIRRSPNARYLAIKLSPSDDRVTLVIPRGVAMARAMAFLEERSGWIVAQWQRLPPRIRFAAGNVIPVLGRDRLIVAAGAKRGTPPFRLTEGAIEIGGDPAHLARRLRTGLLAHARPILLDKSQAMAASLGRQIAKVSLGDPGQRWGSCNSRGNLRYSWRLILAPEPVLDYVVAHEVAHLAEMNHGPRFWSVVAELSPDFETQRAWLKRNGTQLMRYG